MGEHKTNRNAIMANTRPKCGTCVHFIEPQQGDVGECSYWPYGVVSIIIRPGAIAGTAPQALPTTHYAPKARNQFCGQHPDFMRWYGENRNRFREIGALEAQPSEGAA